MIVAPFYVEVVDEDGGPLEGAIVIASYSARGGHGSQVARIRVEYSKTDGNGVANLGDWEAHNHRYIFSPSEPLILVFKQGYWPRQFVSQSERDYSQYLLRVDAVVVGSEGGRLRLAKCDQDIETCAMKTRTYARLSGLLGDVAIAGSVDIYNEIASWFNYD